MQHKGLSLYLKTQLDFPPSLEVEHTIKRKINVPNLGGYNMLTTAAGRKGQDIVTLNYPCPYKLTITS